MLNFICGALGLLGALVFGYFLVSELRSSWREGRRNELQLSPGVLGCLVGFTAPLIVVGVARVPGVGWWSLLTPAAQVVLFLFGRTLAGFLGSTRRVSLAHARSTDPERRQAGVAKLLLATDPSKDRVAREVLEDALQSGDPDILRSSAVTLYRLGLRNVVAEALAKPFLDPERVIRETFGVGRVVQELGADVTGPMLKLLETPSLPPGSRVGVMHALHGLKDEGIVRAIRRALEDADPHVRAGAVEWIGVTDPPGAREWLLPTLKDGASGVRTAALRAFEARRERSAGDDLLPLADDPAPVVRRVALEVLGKLEEPRVAGAAIRALKEPDDEHRYWAILALGKVRAVEAVEPLIAALEDPAIELRPKAAEALGKIGDRRGCDALARSLRHDPLYQTRVRAAEALASLGWRAETPADLAAWAIAKGDWNHPFVGSEETLEGFDAALKDGDAASGALLRLAQLLQDQAAQIPDPWLFRLSELDGVLGPPDDRRPPDPLDCQPVRKAARAEMARRASTK